jgi:hypothetical protein
VSNETHERPGEERPLESDNVISLALRPNGQERASVERHPLENDRTPKKPAIEKDLSISEDAAPLARASEALRENLERHTVDLHEPFHDAAGSQPELERLATAIRSVQREEAVARLPRAAQLPSVPGLGPVNNGLWSSRSLEPEYLTHRDTLRGPRTMIKIVFLVASIFTVPIAYYFWTGGWDPISRAPPELAAFDSKPIMSASTPSREEDITVAHGRDPRKPARGAPSLERPEPQTEQSFLRETVAILPPSTPGADEHRTDIGRTRDAAHDQPSNPAVRALDPEQVKLFIKQGEQFIAAGDVVTARIAFQRAAEAGDANAAVALGATYDPTALARLGVVGISADVAKARSWYQKAEKLGSPEARQRLEVLANR